MLRILISHPGLSRELPATLSIYSLLTLGWVTGHVCLLCCREWAKHSILELIKWL